MNTITGELETSTLLRTLMAFRDGDFSVRLPVDQTGIAGKVCDTLNEIFKLNQRMASEFGRISSAVGKEGRINQRVSPMAGNLTAQVRNIAEVTTAVANGDLSRKITVDVRGEILELKNTINTMVDQLSSFASEVTRVAREVGTEGELGGQAEVTGVG